MGAIEIEPPATGLDAYEAEKCVGEGGHFFEREGDYETPIQGFPVRCERCGTEGVEQPDEGDNPGAIE